MVLAEIPRGSCLYDIGCGSGALLYLALKTCLVKVAHGYDVSEEVVKSAKAFEMSSDIFQVIYLPTEKTPPDLHGYDIVTMVDVLHHIPAKLQDNFLCTTISRMDSGAKLIIKDIEASKFLGSLMNQIHDLLLAREWVYQRRSSDVVKVLRSTGAIVSKPLFRWTLWYPHFQVVVQVP